MRDKMPELTAMPHHTAYFDTSGHPCDSEVVSVSGIVSTPQRWSKFSKEWASALKDHGVTRLHMTDFAQSRKEFSAWAGDEPRRSQFLGRLLGIIESHVELVTAFALYPSDYKAVDAEFELTERLQPYALANAMCLVAISHWGIDAGHNLAEMDFVFEHGDFGQGDFKRSWRESIVKELMPDPIIKKKDDYYPQADVFRCCAVRNTQSRI
jgi:hypothetical protein